MTKQKSVRVLIVDDEPLARLRIATLLSNIPLIEVVGEAEDGHDAITSIRELAPDLVFLDVQMRRMTGIEVVKTIGAANMPVTIFVTAYDRYSLAAFELAALDYLLKPFDDERFEIAVRRAIRMHELRQSDETALHLRKALESLAAYHAASDTHEQKVEYMERIAIESRGQVRMVLVEAIDYIIASGVYAELHVGDKTHIVRERMQHLEKRLNPRYFFRVHRSIIVQLDRIDVLLRQAGGDYNLRLRNGTQLPVSRNRIDELERWMGVPESTHQQ